MTSLIRVARKLAFNHHCSSLGTHVNQSLLQTSSVNQLRPFTSVTGDSILMPTSQQSTEQQSRYFASASENYYKEKQALKVLRTQRYMERQARKEKVKRRRDGRPKRTSQKQFNAWFKPKKRMEQISNSKAKKLGLDWKLQVAVVLERLPVVLPDREPWQAEYEDLRAYLNQFGRDYPEELFGKPEILEVEDFNIEAMMENLPRGYTPAPRETEADASGEVRTLDRRLKTWVYLAVKDSPAIGSEGGEGSLQWQFPTVEVNDEETLLDAAKRAIQDKVGSSMAIYYPSNMPMAVEMHVFEKEERKEHDNTYGTKTFYMVVQYDEGKVKPDDIAVDDFAWLEKSEFVERIKEEQGEEKSKFYQYLLTA